MATDLTISGTYGDATLGYPLYNKVTITGFTDTSKNMQSYFPTHDFSFGEIGGGWFLKNHNQLIIAISSLSELTTFGGTALASVPITTFAELTAQVKEALIAAG